MRDDDEPAPRGGRRRRGEVGDPDPLERPDRYAGLDGRARVVDMDVDIPQAVVAGHHERVAERLERSTQAGDPVRRRGDEVHDLIGRLAGDAEGSTVHGMGRGQFGAPRGSRAPATHPGDDVEQCVVHDDQSLATGIHDPGVAERRQLVRGARERVVSGGDRRLDHLHQAGSCCESPLRGLRCGPGDREDRPFDGVRHGGVRLIAGRAERARDDASREGIAVSRLGQDPGDASDDLREDHPGVAPRPEERTACHRGRDVRHRRTLAELLGAVEGLVDPGARRLDGEEHVGARVPIGDGEDVEGVYGRALLAEGRKGGLGPCPDRGGMEASGRGLRHGHLPAWPPDAACLTVSPGADRGGPPGLGCAAPLGYPHGAAA